jgi:hypothetical protein
MIATASHKLAARSLACIFIGYPADHRGYRCYDPASGRVITSRHVLFDEVVFPFRDIASPAAPYHDVDSEPPLPVPRAGRDARRNAQQRSASPPSPPHPMQPQPRQSQPVVHATPPLNSIYYQSSRLWHLDVVFLKHCVVHAKHCIPRILGTSTVATTITTPCAAAYRCTSCAAPVHPMVTRACAGIHKPNPKYAITATEVISPIP